MLDSQLSRDIDATLSKINSLLPLSPAKPMPTSSLPTAFVTPPPKPRLAPTPPQLPMLEFPGFTMDDAFPQLTSARRSPTPRLTPLTPPLPTLPSWCPALPSFTRNGIWSTGLPTFYDLSSLPEPKAAPKPDSDVVSVAKGKELQLWCGNLDRKPKVSRFFPRSPSPTKPTVKLPPTACKLHVLEKDLPQPTPDKPSNLLHALISKTSVDVVEEILRAFKYPAESSEDTPEPVPSAANLWRILVSPSSMHGIKHDDPYLASFKIEPDSDSYLAAWQAATETQQQAKPLARSNDCEDPYVAGYTSQYGVGNGTYLAAWQAVKKTQQQDNMAVASDHPKDVDNGECKSQYSVGNDDCLAAWRAFIESTEHANSPAELDGRELPYVHANSLTGYTNEIVLSPYAEEHPHVRQPVARFMPLASPPIGLNELMVDYDVFEPRLGESIRLTDDSHRNYGMYPAPLSGSHHSYVLADILPINCIEGDGGEETLAMSDAHFQSEQGLFSLPPLPRSPGESMIDIAEFLKMGHAKHCWCTDCEEVPELVANDKLTETDDDWMLYSPIDFNSMASQPPTEIGDDEKDTARVTHSMTSEWCDFLPSEPRTPEKYESGSFGFVGGLDSD